MFRKRWELWGCDPRRYVDGAPINGKAHDAIRLKVRIGKFLTYFGANRERAAQQRVSHAMGFNHYYYVRKASK